VCDHGALAQAEVQNPVALAAFVLSATRERCLGPRVSWRHVFGNENH
jgi:hypothetical protein